MLFSILPVSSSLVDVLDSWSCQIVLVLKILHRLLSFVYDVLIQVNKTVSVDSKFVQMIRTTLTKTHQSKLLAFCTCGYSVTKSCEVMAGGITGTGRPLPSRVCWQ